MRGEGFYPNRSERERHRPAVKKWSLAQIDPELKGPPVGTYGSHGGLNILSVSHVAHIAGRRAV